MIEIFLIYIISNIVNDQTHIEINVRENHYVKLFDFANPPSRKLDKIPHSWLIEAKAPHELA
jgi:hypothetical protein